MICNILVVYNLKKEFLRKPSLIVGVFLLILKIIFTIPETFSNMFFARVNIMITLLLGLYLLIYVKIMNINLKNKLQNRIFWILFWIYFIAEGVINNLIFLPTFLSYTQHNYIYILKIALLINCFINSSTLVLIIYLIRSIQVQKKDIIKKIERRNIIIVVSFLIASIALKLLAYNNNVFYYLSMFNSAFLFWYIFLTDINVLKIRENLSIKIFQLFLHIYLFFIFTESIWIPLAIIFSFIVLNIYTNFITGILKIDKYYIEKLLNRLYLARSPEEFKEQLSKELKNNLELKSVETKILINTEDYKKYLKDREYNENEILFGKDDILDKKYDYIARLSYGKKSFIGLILIQNKSTKLVFEEKRYLEDIAEKVSIIASKYRMLKLQEELN